MMLWLFENLFVSLQSVQAFAVFVKAVQKNEKGLVELWFR
jgi:hypothetical protein